MSLQSQFKMDATKETEGVDVKVGVTNPDGTEPTFRLLRRSPQNQRYAKTLEKEAQPFRRLLELGTLDAKVSQKILRTTFCRAVLIGWSNVQNTKDEPIPYSFVNAMQLFEELPELYEMLAEEAGKLASFRVETQDADAKN